MKKFYFLNVLILLLLCSCKQQPNYVLSNYALLQVNDSITYVQEFEKFIKPYRDSLESFMNREIGVNEVEIKSYKPDSPLSGFMADIMLQKGRNYLISINETNSNLPSIAIINTGGIRNAFKKGVVTVRTIYEIMPFENTLVALLMKGEDIEELFEHLARVNGDGLSGVTCDLTPTGMKNIIIDSDNFDSEKNYWVFVPDYLAEGGSGYFVFNKVLKKIESNIKIRDIVIEYINNEKTIHYIHNTRINDTRNEKNSYD